ncbi:MAG: hypothetical protein AB7E05_14355 [Sphingobium sp.]
MDRLVPILSPMAKAGALPPLIASSKGRFWRAALTFRNPIPAGINIWETTILASLGVNMVTPTGIEPVFQPWNGISF